MNGRDFQLVRHGESFADTLVENKDAPWVLVACCGKKLDHPAPAQDMYQSDLFQKSRAWAERYGVSWSILSAKYGVLPPGRIIKPYNETLNDKSHGDVVTWNRMVTKQLGALDGRRPTVVLAGSNYRGWIRTGHNVVVPLQGLGIGRQLAWLKNEIERCACGDLESV